MERLKKGDTVIITKGKDIGKQGEVLACGQDNRFLVQGVNLVKKHMKPNPSLGQAGGIIDKEMPIQGANLALINPATGKGDKVAFKILDNGQKVRVFKSNGEAIDN